MSYAYRLPDRLSDRAAVGLLVQVPLAASTALGVIVALSEVPPDLPADVEIREVAEILDPLPAVTPAQIALARWIAGEYLAPLNQAMRLMLPPGLDERTFVVVTRTGPRADTGSLSPEEEAALQQLQRRGGRLRLSTLLGLIPGQDPDSVVHGLAERGLIDSRYTLVPPKAAPPRVQFVRLLADEAAIESALPRLGRASKQADALLVLARRRDAPLTVTELGHLAACSEGPLRALVERGWVEVTARQTWLVAVPGARERAHDDLSRAPKQAAVLAELLDRGGSSELKAVLEATEASPAVLVGLEQKDLVRRVVEEPVALLALPADQVLEKVIELRGAGKERAVLEALAGTTGRVWVGGIYAQTGADLNTLRRLAERGLVSLHSHEYERPPPVQPESPPQLTPDQEQVWSWIRDNLAGQGIVRPGLAALLHGVTGSGKTEIYMRALEATLAAGRRAIVLVPEVSLTAQTVRRFEARFPGRMAVVHSQLTLGQRYAVWDRVRHGEADVIVGPRSALLAPISRLGLIVLDEAHDDSYKQSEPIPLPAYHARDAALALGRLTGALVLLGSATPDLESYYRAQQGTYHLLELPQRILSMEPDEAATGVRRAVAGARRFMPGAGSADSRSRALPPVRVVDLRQELRAGNRSIFSRPLQEALHRTLHAGEQAILFLNRRGAATFVLCRDCGHVARCPDCDVPLTYHHRPAMGNGGGIEPPDLPETTQLVCHHCNHREPPPSRCPVCGGQRIRYFGLGTERVEAAVHELYPEARLLRWDADTASGPDHERFLQAFVDQRANVLVGTQMIAKGLDLPLVTLVGVISADTALHLPDFRSAERTFQLLAQVAGRAGRSRRGGQVIVQTYDPEHYAVQAAANHDYAAFYRQELTYRRQLGYPPFSRLVALRLTDRDAHRCRVEAERLGRWLAAEIRRRALPAYLIGPAPCFFSRVQGRHRWQIVVRAPDPIPLLRDVALPRGWRVDVDPTSLL